MISLSGDIPRNNQTLEKDDATGDQASTSLGKKTEINKSVTNQIKDTTETALDAALSDLEKDINLKRKVEVITASCDRFFEECKKSKLKQQEQQEQQVQQENKAIILLNKVINSKLKSGDIQEAYEICSRYTYCEPDQESLCQALRLTAERNNHSANNYNNLHTLIGIFEAKPEPDVLMLGLKNALEKNDDVGIGKWLEAIREYTQEKNLTTSQRDIFLTSLKYLIEENLKRYTRYEGLTWILVGDIEKWGLLALEQPFLDSSITDKALTKAIKEEGSWDLFKKLISSGLLPSKSFMAASVIAAVEDYNKNSDFHKLKKYISYWKTHCVDLSLIELSIADKAFSVAARTNYDTVKSLYELGIPASQSSINTGLTASVKNYITKQKEREEISKFALQSRRDVKTTTEYEKYLIRYKVNHEFNVLLANINYWKKLGADRLSIETSIMCEAFNIAVKNHCDFAELFKLGIPIDMNSMNTAITTILRAYIEGETEFCTLKKGIVELKWRKADLNTVKSEVANKALRAAISNGDEIVELTRLGIPINYEQLNKDFNEIANQYHRYPSKQKSKPVIEELKLILELSKHDKKNPFGNKIFNALRSLQDKAENTPDTEIYGFASEQIESVPACWKNTPEPISGACPKTSNPSKKQRLHAMALT